MRRDFGAQLGWSACAGAMLVLAGCSSGSGGSNVGASRDIPPTARAQVLNGGATDVFREGSEVLLTGKDSEDGDGPPLSWSWRQISGPPVRLIERNATTVSFTAPDVTTATTLTFELTVADSGGLTDDASIDVTVIPAEDADKFLSLDVRGATRNTFDRFEVVAALAEGASTNASAKPFTLSVRAYIVYPPRSRPNVHCPNDLLELTPGLPSSTASGCAVELLEDLTPSTLPGGGTGIEGEWPANVVALPRPNGPTADQLDSEWWNPRYTFKIPRLDFAEFNQQFVDSGERDRMLDAFNAHETKIVLALELTAPQNQQDANLIFDALDGAVNGSPFGPSPKTLPAFAKVIGNDGVGLPTSVVVPLDVILGAIAGRESALTAEVYYRTVDPDNSRTTLNAWLEQAGFASDGEGRLLPEAIAGTGDFAHAVYLNNYDLGFGRDMYTRVDDFGNAYSFVVNYATLEAAIRKSFPIVTVAMEYSALNGPADPTEKFVKFFTYVDDGSGDSRRATSIDFDGRGERFTPGNCTVCHGGVLPPGLDELEFDDICGNRLDAACYTWPERTRDGTVIANGNLNGTFLPWDLNSLLFADTDPAITRAPTRFDGRSLGERLLQDHGDYSRAAQEAQLKKLNQTVLATYCDLAQAPACTTDFSRRLVEHWYGGVDQDGNLIANGFDDSAPPEGWRNGDVVPTPTPRNPAATRTNPDTTEEIYHSVFAQHCRMCHANIATATLRFDNYQKFAAQADAMTALVFEQGVMPSARLTSDRFWVDFNGGPSAAARLAQELGVEPVDGELGPRPLAAIAGSGGMVPRHSPIRLSAHDSLFADNYRWTVEYTPPTELLGNPELAAFKPTLVGASMPELSFSTSKSGTYSIALAINDGDGAGLTAGPVEFTVPNFAPHPSDFDVLIAEGGSSTFSVLDQLNWHCAVPGCTAVFGDGPFSIAVNLAGWNPAHGAVALDDSSTGTITIAGTQPGPIATSIPFSVRDADAEVGSGLIGVRIEALTNPVALEDRRTMHPQSTVSASTEPPAPRALVIDVLSNDAGAPSALPLQVDVFSQAANGQVTQSGDQLVYTPRIGFVGTDEFTYRVNDSASPLARLSSDAAVRVSVQQTVTFSDAVDALDSAGCFRCHGVFATAPNWRDYDLVTQPAIVSPPESAIESRLLTYPPTHFAGWTRENEHFRTVWTWIEEGALP